MATEIGPVWIELLKIGGTGVVAATLTVGLNWLVARRTEHAKLERDARYLAIRVSVVLERFALDCAEFAGDNDLHRRSDGAAGQHRASVPSIAAYPTDADWKALPQDLLAECLSLPTEIEQTSRGIDFVSDVAPDDAPAACDEACAALGLRALDLAKRLRGRYGFPPLKSSDSEYDLTASLQAHFDDAKKRRQRGGLLLDE
jgi:hypothetical protein